MSDTPIHGPVTLRTLLEIRPEWADLPLVISNENGLIEWVGCSGSVFPTEVFDDVENKEVRVLAFTGN